ncbi:unnamed protein product [Dibothriocephalus latus]|uniref:Uncharacterized protein n=1 Tax=Dibothriocephalus latus TaxID=60516 RepID=A0A3P7PJS0_DIBLA|nr:unnamed protein product [Dibothriocephalus latus]
MRSLRRFTNTAVTNFHPIYARYCRRCGNKGKSLRTSRTPHLFSSTSDDCTFNTTSKMDMQSSKGPFAAGCVNFGVIIITDRTAVMYQPPPGTDYNAPRISVNGAELKNVDNFAYVGSTLSRNTRIDDAVAQQLSSLRPGFRPLCGTVTVFNCP